MEIRRLNEFIGVAPQIGPEDVAAIMRAGFCPMLSHHLDDEPPGHLCGHEWTVKPHRTGS